MDKRFKPLTPHEQLTIRRELFAQIESNPGQPLAATVAMLRKGLRMTVPEYAALCGVATRLLYDLESGRGNPSLSSVEKLLKPFGLQLGVVKAAANATD